MIHAVIKIDDKSDQVTGLIGLRAYFPQKISLLVGVHEFCKDGQLDMKEEFRCSFEHNLTQMLMKEEIREIIRLQQIIPYCKSNDEAVSEAIGICEKLEKNLHVKAKYEGESHQSNVWEPVSATNPTVLIDDSIPINKPTKEQVNVTHASMQDILKKHKKGM